MHITSEHPFPWPDPITLPSPASVKQVDTQPASPGSHLSLWRRVVQVLPPWWPVLWWLGRLRTLLPPPLPHPVPFHSTAPVCVANYFRRLKSRGSPISLRFTRSLKIKVLKDKSNKLNIYQKKLRNLHINETEINTNLWDFKRNKLGNYPVRDKLEQQKL